MNEHPANLDRRLGPTAAETHRRDLSQRTRGEQDELLEAMHRLEAALASPAPGRAENWAVRVGKELSFVQIALQSHILSAEGSQGLFEELDRFSPAKQRKVDELRQEHYRLLEMAASLSSGLNSGCDSDFAALRREATGFLNTLRHHHAAEVDLIYECFWLDIGVGD